MALAITLLDDNQRRVLQRAERIFKAPGEVREWSRAASERATRFQCATGQLYAFDPLSVELQAHIGATRGRPVTCSSPRAKGRFGFDSAERLVLAEGPGVSGRSFVHVLDVNGESGTSAVVSEDGPGLDRFRVRSVVARDRDGDPWIAATYGEGARWYVEEHVGGLRPTRINSTWSNGNMQSVSVEWFDDGHPKRVFHYPDGPNLWLSKEVKRTLSIDSFALRLVGDVLRVLSDARAKLEFNCVALCVDDSTPLPPTLCVAHIEDFSGFVWADPYTMNGAVSGRDEACLAAYSRKLVEDGNDLNLRLADRREHVVSVLVDVARDLSVRLWRSDRTLVYVADLTRSDWVSDVDRSVPTPILRAAGLRA